MAVINGGEVLGITFSMERDIASSYHRYLLVQHRSRRFYYLMDRLRMVCPDLDVLLSHFEDIGNDRLVKYVKGRITRAMLIRYMEFFLHPQQYGHKGDLIFFSNWIIMVGFLQRLTAVAIHNYNLPDRLYTFTIPTDKLHKHSKLWAKDMLPIVQDKMIPHYYKLTGAGE